MSGFCYLLCLRELDTNWKEGQLVLVVSFNV